MTPSELKYNHENKNPNSYYFTRSTMKFFGDTMKNYGCYKTKIDINIDGTTKEKNVYALHRKRPVKNGMQKTTYFDMETFEVVRGI